MLVLSDDDDDEWTQVSTSQLHHADTNITDTSTADSQAQVIQHDQDAAKPSADSQTHTSSSPAAVTSSLLSSSDAPDSQHMTAAESCSSDVTGAPADSAHTQADFALTPADSALAQSVVDPAASTDQDSVGSSVSSDQTKSDSLVVVASMPERTSPSEESSNAKGSLVSF